MANVKVSLELKKNGQLERAIQRINKNYGIYVGYAKDAGFYTYHSYEYEIKGKRKGSKKGIKEKAPLMKVVDVAYINVFGSEKANIPARDFMRGSVLKNAKKYVDMMKSVVRKVLNNSLDLLIGLKKIAVVGQTDMQDFIKDFISPPNAPSTVKRKGFNNPLFYKGTLIQKVTWQVKEEKK